MRLLRPILIAAAAAALLPEAARAAELAPIAACYRSVDSETREMIPVVADGFPPGEQVNVAIDGEVVATATALPSGGIEGTVKAPYSERGERAFTLTVTEADQPTNTVGTTSRVSALAMRLKPKRTAPSRRVRFIGRGFTDPERVVYAHYVRKGRLRKTVRLGPANGPCGTINVMRRQIPVKRPATGRWTVQVDNQPTYSRESVCVRVPITVRRGPRLGG
jgi:hypothetical protein